jgi:hypothetical protein
LRGDELNRAIARAAVGGFLFTDVITTITTKYNHQSIKPAVVESEYLSSRLFQK